MNLFEEIVELIPQLPRDPDRAFPPAGVGVGEIMSFEARMHIQVPPELRQWLEFINGAGIGPGGIYGINTSTADENIEELYRLFPAWVNNGWIPVGGDGCGNYYVLATRPEDGPGRPVFFIEVIEDPYSPCYVVASDLYHFLKSYFKRDLGIRGWPCDPEIVIAEDPALSAYQRYPKCWEA